MTRRVVAKIVGGIGNQLFCYAAARRLALKNDAELCLDVNFFRSDIHYRREYRLDGFALPPHQLRRSARLLPEAIDHYAWRLKRGLAGRGLLPGCDGLIEAVPGVFEPRVLSARVDSTTLIDGYWQDERYFADVAHELRADLAFRPDAVLPERELAARIASSNAVAVHSRRQYGAADALGSGYYVNALAAVNEKIARPEFFCFGDDPDWLLAHWPRGLPVTVVHHAGLRGDVADLRLMSQCRHYIIANSSFSWWGAWLGSDPAKVVVAPRAAGRKYEVRSAAGWLEVGG